MDITGILDELRESVANIDIAIAAMERLASGEPKKRGRPPKWMAAAKSAGVAPKKAAAKKKPTAPRK